MSNITGPQVGDTAKKLTSINGGTTLVPVTVARVIESSSNPDYPYLVTFEYSYTTDGEAHGGEIMTRLNARGEDQHDYTIGYRRAEYIVLLDPMDDLSCDSCQ